jgi:hypothetical protein
MLEFVARRIVKMQEEVFDTCEGKAVEFGDEDLELDKKKMQISRSLKIF